MTISIVNSYNVPVDMQIVGIAMTPVLRTDIHLPTGLQQNDVVYIIGAGDENNFRSINTHNTNANGFIQVYNLDGDGSPIFTVLRNVVSATAYANCNVGYGGNGWAWMAIAVRGANPYAPEAGMIGFDSSSGMPDAPAAWVSTGKSLVLSIGCLADVNVVLTLDTTKPAGYNVRHMFSPFNDVVTLMVGDKIRSTGEEDPAIFEETTGLADDTSKSLTLVIQPAQFSNIAAPYLSYGYAGPTKDFFDRLSTQPTIRRAHQYDAFIKRLIASGAWNYLDAIYLFAAADAATARTNLKSANYGITAVGSLTFTADSCYQTDGSTGYLDTNFNPTTATSPNFVQNDCSAFMWINNRRISGDAQESDNAEMGNGDGSIALVRAHTSLGHLTYRLNSAAAEDGGAIAREGPLVTWCARSSGLPGILVMGRNDERLNAAEASTSPHNSNINFFRCNSLFARSDRELLAGGFGGGSAIFGNSTMSDLDLFNSIHIWAQEVAGLTANIQIEDM